MSTRKTDRPFIIARIVKNRGAQRLAFVEYGDVTFDTMKRNVALAMSCISYTRDVRYAMQFDQQAAILLSMLASKKHSGEFAVIERDEARTRYAFTNGRRDVINY